MKYRMHVVGPDDIEDFDDELAALRKANEINKICLDLNKEHWDDGTFVLQFATVTPLPTKDGIVDTKADSDQLCDHNWIDVGSSKNQQCSICGMADVDYLSGRDYSGSIAAEIQDWLRKFEAGEIDGRDTPRAIRLCLLEIDRLNAQLAGKSRGLKPGTVRMNAECSYWAMRLKGRSDYPYREHWADCIVCQKLDPDMRNQQVVEPLVRSLQSGKDES